MLALIFLIIITVINLKFFDYSKLEDKLKIYLINLDNNNRRLYSFKQEFNNTDLKRIGWTRFSAINGREINLKNYLSEVLYDEVINNESNGYRTSHPQLTKGAVGCFLSHVGIYRLMLAENVKYGLILEDDVQFIQKDILNTLNKIIQDVPYDWDLILLGHRTYKFENNPGNFYKVRRFYLLHAYIINKKGINKILTYIQQNPLDKQFDHYLSDMASKNQLNIYATKKQYARQNRKFKTQIQLPVRVL